MSNRCNGIWFDTKELSFFGSLRATFIVTTFFLKKIFHCHYFSWVWWFPHKKNHLLTYLQQIKLVQWETDCTQEGAFCFFTSWVSGSGLQFTMGAFHLLPGRLTLLSQSLSKASFYTYAVSKACFLHPQSSLVFCRLANRYIDALLLKTRTVSLAVTIIFFLEGTAKALLKMY